MWNQVQPACARLLERKPCPCWTASVLQFDLKQPALLLKIKAEAREEAGEFTEGELHVPGVTETAVDGNDPLEMAMLVPPKCPTPHHKLVHLGTVKHLLDEAPRFTVGRALGDP